MKRELIDDVLTGLVVAAVLSAVILADAIAQNLADVGTGAQQGIMKPFVHFVSYVSYTLGTIMTVAGIAKAKAHADNPGNAPLAQALGRLGAGAAFLAAPMLASTLVGTASNVGINGNGANFNVIGGNL